MRTKKMVVVAAVAAMTLAAAGARGFALGCVAAHSNQRSMDELVRAFDGGTRHGWSIHNVTVDVG